MLFSVTYYDKKVKLYKSRYPIYSPHILSYSNIDNEITIYKYIADDDELFELASISKDHQIYHLFNIHEDSPGIDHIGIVNYISGLFTKQNIPILYINTYSYNLILVQESFIEKALLILQNNKSIIFNN